MQPDRVTTNTDPRPPAPRTEAGRRLMTSPYRPWPAEKDAQVLIGVLAIEAESITNRYSSAARPAEPLDEWARWIVRWTLNDDDEGHVYDGACAECMPHGTGLIEGFRCVPHQAAARLRDKEEERPPKIPGVDRPRHFTGDNG